MAGTNVTAMTQIASMSLNERDFHSSTSDFNDGEKKVASHNTTSLDVESDQPTGLKRMEAITQVWTKKWLVAAYALYVVHLYVEIILIGIEKHHTHRLHQFSPAADELLVDALCY
jgi:hypothetical protein